MSAEQQHRLAILEHPKALNCTVYRPDEEDPEAEELDLGDGKVVLGGPFEPPAEWDAQEREEYFEDTDPALFVTARIECDAQPDGKGYFEVEPGDFVAVLAGRGKVQMYFVYDCTEDDSGRQYVLILDDEE
ncbi:hypothetical protein [Zestomonas carbonaria]|uniref:Uncharacterized protein n=1 Tax=Zestomonas carbonaria TaxID=2762745 RepID=A0A7U7ETQ9_9GAMM|nr:hypothetical protein [Pseudomonas carbonaria]CAD5110510.1 hypothetical protein PSEWESI4_04833 [Pseudomonas carbonaria]